MLKDLRSLLYYDKYYKNEVKQISSQKQLKTTASLGLQQNQIPDPIDDLGEYLSNFGENLKGQYAFLDLVITSPIIKNLDAVVNYQCIERLVIENTSIEDVSRLNELGNLIDCKLSNNCIKTLPNRLHDSLLYLDLSSNQLESFINLSMLIKLKKLNLANNRITQIINTGYNESLRELDLSSNSISDLSSLGQFRNLTTLRMRDCRIKNLNGIQRLTKLTVLDISGNGIRSLEPLSWLTELKVLNLSDNNITQIFELKCVKGLNSLMSVDFTNNPITQIKFYKHIVLNDMPFILEMDGSRLSEKEYVETEVFFGADLAEKKWIADKFLGEGHFEDNRILHSEMKEFKDIVTDPPKLYKADFY